jgi:Lrp/AsnC family transcriptional regulator, leucine-responsive regulatory protein
VYILLTKGSEINVPELPPDPISRSILRLLAVDGRASYQAIADEVGLSRPAVMERVKRLEETGYIQGYHARLDRAKVGFPITAFVAVRMPASDHEGEEVEIKSLAANPHVLECHHVAGEDCYMLKVAAPTIESLEGVLREIRRPGRAVSTRTTIVLSSMFEKPGIVPVEPD